MGCSSIDAHVRDDQSGILLHRIHDILCLISQRFERRTDQVRFRSPSRQSKESTTHILIPIRCPQSDKRWNHIDVLVRFKQFSIFFRFGCSPDQLGFIAQPLQSGSGHKDAPLKGIRHFAIQPVGDGSQQAILRFHRCKAGVHNNERAGTVSILYHTLFKSGLPEKGGLLIAGDSGYRDARTVKIIFFGITIYFR